MRNGHWLFTGDAIRFTNKPELIDGQHRMKALIKANITLPMVCVFGLDPRAKHALDMGRKRSAADALALKGHTQSSRLSGAARQLLYIKHNSQSARVTNAEIEELVERHPKLADVTHHFDNTPDISPALLTALYYVLAYLMDDEATAIALQNAMRYHHAKRIGDPVIALRQKLSSKRPTEQLSRTALIHVINKKRKGQTTERAPITLLVARRE